MKLFALILTVTILIGCSNNDDNEVTIEPKCLQTIIDNVLLSEPTTPRASIAKYNYNSLEVYLITIPPGNNAADYESFLRDSNCNLICLIGGIDGNPSSECSGFNNTSEFLETIWSDPR